MTTPPTPPQPNGCTCPTASAKFGPEDWLTPDEVVTLLRGALSLGTLRNYRSARIGPEYVRVGRGIFYPRAAVGTWLAEQIRQSADRWADRA